MAARLAWKPEYEGDEVALGVALAFALHAIPLVAIVLKATYPSPQSKRRPSCRSRSIGATLLKLGKPIDPKKLPDRLVPQQRARRTRRSSRRARTRRTRPTSPTPGRRRRTRRTRTSSSSSRRPIRSPRTRTRIAPSRASRTGATRGRRPIRRKVHAGDEYAAALQKFFSDRWQIPTVISVGEEAKLCSWFQVAVDPRMRVWFVKATPDRPSGNDLFDDSARSMLQKLVDDHTPLPDPPDEIADQFRGRRIQLKLGKGCR